MNSGISRGALHAQVSALASRRGASIRSERQAGGTALGTLFSLLLAGSLSTAALAQTAQRVPVPAFARDPSHYLNQRIRIDKLGCFLSADSGYRCTTYKGLYVVAGDILPASAKSKIKEECGGIVEEEDDPTCLFDLVFTPVAVAKGQGQLTQGDRSVTGPVWMVRSDAVVVTIHK